MNPSTEKPAKEELDKLKDQFIEKLSKQNDGYIGNMALMKELVWPPEKYWPIRDILLDEGKIKRGRGQGGSVQLIPDSYTKHEVEKEAESGYTENKFNKESELYEYCEKIINEYWVKDYRYQRHIVEITANAGSRQTGGKWTRPDITLLGISTYLYLPNKYFDITTFEIKTHAGFDIVGLYEALAHRRFATRSYVVYHVPSKERNDEYKKYLYTITYEAKKHGIGVIVIEDPDKYETWIEEVEATRVTPDPDDMNEFIISQVSEKSKNEVLHWIK